MKVLIACELYGKVRDAFRALGHEAFSCDIYWVNSPYHIHDDVMNHLNEGWDLMIAHPPCTHLAVSGSRWFKNKIAEQKQALEFVQRLMDAKIDKIAIENPISVISSKIRKPDQIIQPWQFGHRQNKATCLWLKNLPKLKPTNVLTGVMNNHIHEMWGGKNRGRERSITFDGIALAMAEQWGGNNVNQ